MKTELRKYEVWTYDVWGDAKYGYEVNDNYHQGDIVLHCPIKWANTKGITDSPTNEPSEFPICDGPSDDQLREIFSLREDTSIDVDGDEQSIYVNLDDGYPVGELRLID